MSSRTLKVLVLAAAVCGAGAIAAAAPSNAPAPEPSGYWTGPVNSPVPATLSGGNVISNAHRLHALLNYKDTVLIDVSNAPHRPDNMAPGAPWLPLPHRAIPGTVWIPSVGAGEIPVTLDSFFRQKLATATDNDRARRVIIYCHRTCWLSWNAARRAISYGYQHIYWYRDGVEGWKAAGLATAVIEPQIPASASQTPTDTQGPQTAPPHSNPANHEFQ